MSGVMERVLGRRGAVEKVTWEGGLWGGDWGRGGCGEVTGQDWGLGRGDCRRWRGTNKLLVNLHYHQNVTKQNLVYILYTVCIIYSMYI